MNRSKAVLAAVLLSSASAFAYRPFDGTDAAVAEWGELELELGPIGVFHTPGTTNLYVPFVVLNFGFAPGWELVAQGRNEVLLEHGTDDHIGDTGVFLKGVLFDGTLQGSSGVSVATEVGLLLPTYHDEGGAGASVSLIFSYAWKPVTLHVNVQAGVTRERPRFDGTKKNNLDLFGSVILEGPRAWAVRPVAEVYFDDEFGYSPTVSGLFGVLWPVAKNVTIDLAVRGADRQIDPNHGPGSNLGELEVRAGVTWSISLFGETGTEVEHGPPASQLPPKPKPVPVQEKPAVDSAPTP